MRRFTVILICIISLIFVSCADKESSQKVTELSTTVSALSSKVEALEKENSDLKGRLSNLEGQTQSAEKQISQMNEKYDLLTGKLSAIEESSRLSSEGAKDQLKRVEALEDSFARQDTKLTDMIEREKNKEKIEPAYLDIVFDLEMANPLSDSTQVARALEKGGEIYVSSEYSYLEHTWTEIKLKDRTLKLEDYGAIGESGTYYTRGAMINLTVQQGWKLLDIDYGYETIIIYHFTR